MSVDWQRVPVAVERGFADVMKFDIGTVRSKQPPADWIDCLADVLSNWPVDICRMVADFAFRSPHAWQSPSDDSPDWTSVEPVTAKTDYQTDEVQPASVPWYRVASDRTLRTGCRRWMLRLDCTLHSGWIGCGVTADDCNPLIIRQGNWYSAVLLGRDPYWLAVNASSVVVYDAGGRENWICAWPPLNASIVFEADFVDLTVSATIGDIRYLLVDCRNDGLSMDRFYDLRPAVLLGGTASATFVESATMDD